jgi:hypothetical protein
MFIYKEREKQNFPGLGDLNVALKMSTDLLSCWVCRQEGRNHGWKAGVRAPLLQRQFTLKLEDQGHSYLQGNKDIIITTPNLPVTFHSSGLAYSLCWHQPRSSQTELSVPDSSDGGATPQVPFENVLNLFLLHCFSDINPPAQGASDPSPGEAHSGWVKSEQP